MAIAKFSRAEGEAIGATTSASAIHATLRVDWVTRRRSYQLGQSALMREE